MGASRWVFCFALAAISCDCSDGEGTIEDLVVSPETLDFGVVITASECTRELLMSNLGAGTISFTGNNVVEGDSVFRPAEDAPVTMVAGQERPIGVVYAPTGAGVADSGILEINFEVAGKTAKRSIALAGYAVDQRAPRIDARCEQVDGEAGDYGACATLIIDKVQSGQHGVARLMLHNLGTEVLHISRIAIESDSGRWSLDGAEFLPPGGLPQPVVLPVVDGAEAVPVRNAVTGDCGQEESGDGDVPLQIDMGYFARDVGVDEAVLVISSDDPFVPELRLPMRGVGNGRKGVISPLALVVTGGDTSEVTIRSLGNTPFPINTVYLDFDRNGEKDPDDFGCRPGTRSAEEGPLTCSSSRGSGFRLDAYDGADGGSDEAVFTIYHTGGAPARSQLVLESDAASVGIPGGARGRFIVPIGTMADAQLAVVAAESMPFSADDGSVRGTIEIRLSNPGGADTAISGWNFLAPNGSPLPVDNWLMQATELTDLGVEVSFPLTVPAAGQVVLQMALSGVQASTWPEALVAVFHHDGLAAQPLAMGFSLALPQ